MKRIPADIFETSDLYLASFLLTCGLRLTATDARNPDRVIFILTPRPEAEHLAAYAEGQATANIGDFGRALKTLERALWAAREESRWARGVSQ